jgi:hypothetical protein
MRPRAGYNHNLYCFAGKEPLDTRIFSPLLYHLSYLASQSRALNRHGR